MVRKILRPKDVQKILGFGKNKIYALWNDPEFPGYRIGRSLVVHEDDFKEWLRPYRRRFMPRVIPQEEETEYRRRLNREN